MRPLTPEEFRELALLSGNESSRAMEHDHDMTVINQLMLDGLVHTWREDFPFEFPEDEYVEWFEATEAGERALRVQRAYLAACVT